MPRMTPNELADIAEVAEAEAEAYEKAARDAKRASGARRRKR